MYETKTEKEKLQHGSNQEYEQDYENENMNSPAEHEFHGNFLSSGNEFQEVFGNDTNDSKKVNDTPKSDANYKFLLEQKIRTQAARLCELQEYISLCEKRIQQIYPGHPLPLNDSHLTLGVPENLAKSEVKSDPQLMSILTSQKYQIQSLTNKLSMKEADVTNLENKLEVLQVRYNNLFEALSTTKYSIKGSLLLNENTFPSLDHLPREKVFEAYSQLHEAFKKTIRDKEYSVDSLKQEIIKNDQQRNYIEILKQAIESAIIKHGLKHCIDNQKNLYYKDTSASNVDVVLDIIQLKTEAEMHKQDSLLMESLNSELRAELERLTAINGRMKAKIQESLETGMKDLQEAKERVKSLENERDYLCENLNRTKLDNERLCKELEEETEKHNNLMENKLGEYKARFEKITQEFESNLNEREQLEKKFRQVEKSYKETSDDNAKLKIQLTASDSSQKEIQERYEKLKEKHEELKHNLNSSLKLLSESDRSAKQMKSEIEHAHKGIADMKSQLENLEKEHTKLRNENNLLNQSKQEKESNEKISRNQLEKDAEQLRSQVKQLSKNSELSEKDKINFANQYHNEIVLLKNENAQLNNDKNQLMKEIEQLRTDINHLQLTRIENENLLKETIELKSQVNENKKKCECLEKNYIQMQTDVNIEKLKTEGNKLLAENEALRKESIELKAQVAQYLTKSQIANDYEKENLQLRQDYEKALSKINNDLHSLNLENNQLKRDSNEFSTSFNTLLGQYENLTKSYKNLEVLYNALTIEKENILKELIDNRKQTDDDSITFIQNRNSHSNAIEGLIREKKEIEAYYIAQLEYSRTEKNDMESFFKNEFNKLQDEKTMQTMKANQLENEIIKRNSEFERLLAERKHLEHEISQKENYIQLIESELRKYQTLQESGGGKNIQNPSSQGGGENEYDSIAKRYEKALKEIKSYKNDNKKLYDQNKKVMEENSKMYFYSKENKLLSNLLNRIITFHISGETKRLANDIVSLHSSIMSHEVERAKQEKRIDCIDKDLIRLHSATTNNEKDAYAYELLKEKEGIMQILKDYDRKINEKFERLKDIDGELKYIEDKLGGALNTVSDCNNIFKGNYVDYESTASKMFPHEKSKPVTLIANEGTQTKKQAKESSERLLKNKAEQLPLNPMIEPTSSLYKRALEVNYK